MRKFDKNSAPILVVLGQSNAHAHATKLPDDEIIRTPLKNVHGLSREYNQAYGLDDVTWTGFTTGGMNLGETQDDTCCLANVFAAKWQKAIDDGAELPDLYIIQISNVSGSMGDVYCVLHLARLPREILIQDTGVRMRIFAPQPVDNEESK